MYTWFADYLHTHSLFPNFSPSHHFTQSCYRAHSHAQFTYTIKYHQNTLVFVLDCYSHGLLSMYILSFSRWIKKCMWCMVCAETFVSHMKIPFLLFVLYARCVYFPYPYRYCIDSRTVCFCLLAAGLLPLLNTIHVTEFQWLIVVSTFLCRIVIVVASRASFYTTISFYSVHRQFFRAVPVIFNVQ